MMRPILKPQGRLECNGGISELLIFSILYSTMHSHMHRLKPWLKSPNLGGREILLYLIVIIIIPLTANFLIQSPYQLTVQWIF